MSDVLQNGEGAPVFNLVEVTNLLYGMQAGTIQLTPAVEFVKDLGSIRVSGLTDCYPIIGFIKKKESEVVIAAISEAPDIIDGQNFRSLGDLNATAADWQGELVGALQYLTPEGIKNAKRITQLRDRFEAARKYDLDPTRSPLLQTKSTGPNKVSIAGTEVGSTTEVTLTRVHLPNGESLFSGDMLHWAELSDGSKIQTGLVPAITYDFVVSNEAISISFGPKYMPTLKVSWMGGDKFECVPDVAEIRRQMSLGRDVTDEDVNAYMQGRFSQMLDALLEGTALRLSQQ